MRHRVLRERRVLAKVWLENCGLRVVARVWLENCGLPVMENFLRVVGELRFSR